MERYRVVIATTAGPSLVKGLSVEDPGVHSVICLDDSEQDLPISPAYHRFVRDPTGVIERHFREPTWRMDVSDRIEAGNSWKLGVFVAHALHAAGRLAPADDRTAPVLWLTGDVTRSLDVRPVGQIRLKLDTSREFLAECAAAGTPARLFLPAPDVEDAADAPVVGVATVAEVLEQIGLPLPDQTRRARLATEGLQPAVGLDFTALLREKRWNFTGRAWLFDDVRRWIGEAVDERVLVLVGDPGAGKSALIAQLSGEAAIAHHFCQADVRVTLDCGRFVRSIAAMVAHACPDLAAVLTRPDVAEFMTTEACQVDPAAAMDFGLIRLLGELRPEGRRAVILVDGLDESLAAGGRLTISELLGSRANRLPPGVAVVATARPDARVLRHFEGSRILRLDADDPRNLEDVRSFVASRLSPQAVDRICEWSGGNFLYARHVVESVDRGDDILSGGGVLPPGLDSLYSRLFERHWPNGAGYPPARRILATVIAAREPLSSGQIGAALRCSGGDLDHAVLEALGPCLRADGQKMEMFHASIIDWLTGPDARAGPFSLSRAEGEAILATWCQHRATDPDAYVLSHAAAHLRAIGDVAGIHALTGDKAFVAAKSRRPDLEYSLRDDEAELIGAHLDAGRDEEAVALVLAGNPVRGAALAAAASRLGDAGRIRQLAVALLGARPGHPSVRLKGVSSALAIAARHGMGDLIIELLRDPEPAVRSVVATTLYALWRRDREAGWDLIETAGSGLFSVLGIPDRRVLDVLGGVTLALVGGHLDDREAMERLHAFWRGWIGTALRRPAARIAGRKWATALAVPSLRLLLQRQPDYQPLNLAEIDHAVMLCQAHRPAREIAIAALETPRTGLDDLQRVLCNTDLEFDLILMLAAERALVLAGSRDPEPTFDLLAHLATDGARWFRQSVLYAGFHVARTRSENRSIAERYLPLSAMILSGDRALFTTACGTYQMIPHIAWAEVLAHATGLPAGERTGTLLDLALATPGDGLVERIVAAAEVLSLGYGLHQAALDILRPIARSKTERTAGSLEQTLANIRFRAGDAVDAFLFQLDEARLLRQVELTLPNVGASDFPTWIDDMFVDLLLRRARFRDQIAHAFRDASSATRTSTLLSHVVPWVADLIVEPER